MVEQKISVAVLFADVSDSTRLYESLGGKARATLVPGFPVSGARAVDLLERDVDAPGVEVTDQAVELALRPFQLVTLRLPRA